MHHTGGPYYTEPIAKKKNGSGRSTARCAAAATLVKRVLVRVPGVRRLNARYGWFVAPGAEL